MAAPTTDKEERAKRRRLRESRARKVLVAGAALSLTVGTAAIYAANDESNTTIAELPTLESTAETTIARNEDEPVSTAAINVQTKARAFMTTDDSEDANNGASEAASTDEDEYENNDEDDHDEGEDEDDYAYQSEAPAATTAPTTNQSPSVTPTPIPAEIVIDQPSSHTRSSSTRD